MSILAKCKFVDKRMKMPAVTEHEKMIKEQMVQFAKDHDGQEFFMEIHSLDEISFDKNIPNYYRKIVLPTLFIKMKDEYNLISISDCDAVLSVMFLQFERVKNDEVKTKYKIVKRVEEVTFPEQGRFLASVANIAITKYGVRFPSAPEIQKQL